MAVTAVREARPARPATAAQASPLERRRRRLFWPFVAPALLLYMVFYIVPTLVTAWISFNDWAGAGPMRFAGLDNYRRLMLDPVFHDAFTNTLIILFVVGGATFAMRGRFHAAGGARAAMPRLNHYTSAAWPSSPRRWGLTTLMLRPR